MPGGRSSCFSIISFHQNKVEADDGFQTKTIHTTYKYNAHPFEFNFNQLPFI